MIVIEARRQAGGQQAAPVVAIGALARYDRPAPALDAYDSSANQFQCQPGHDK